MNAKKEYITNLANNLIAKKRKMSGGDLALDLNNNGHRTNSNHTYVIGGRGVYRLLHATYDSLVSESRQGDADNIANAFTDSYGNPAWNK
ncbi:hypothetical protein [Pedobacter sp. BMA]|uniref:hypothetical protein n=1 Tax=Pedobacter sp. BMA TaxID=1663685 RepID=UPI0006495820|nr:hypothetical protein [Pedobacter sp. BMA]KLT66468.1 hypothetical protein AB669_04555 [Pedobacter sp. BMA]